MKKYELVLLLNSHIKSDERDKEIKEIESLFDWKVIKKDEIWKLELTYPLKWNKENDTAYFVSYYLNLDNDFIEKIKKEIYFRKNILRWRLFSVSSNQEMFEFVKLQSELNEIIESWWVHKYWHKITFFTNSNNLKYLTWKAIPILKKYITRFSDIKPRRYTNNSLKVQKKVRINILRAKELWLLEYVK